MRYVLMDIEEAVKYCKGKKVLVAEQDLEKNEVVGFERKNISRVQRYYRTVRNNSKNM